MRDKTLEWIRECLEHQIADIYGNPNPEQASLTAEVDRLRDVAQDLEIDFDQVAKEVASPHEIDRVASYLAGDWWDM